MVFDHLGVLERLIQGVVLGGLLEIGVRLLLGGFGLVRRGLLHVMSPIVISRHGGYPILHVQDSSWVVLSEKEQTIISNCIDRGYTRPSNCLPSFGAAIGGSSARGFFGAAGVGLPILAGARLCRAASRLVGAALGAAAVAGALTPGLAIPGFFGESGSLSTDAVDPGRFNDVGLAGPGFIPPGRAVAAPPFVPCPGAGFFAPPAAGVFATGRCRALTSAFSNASLILVLRISSTPSRN